MAKLPRKVNSTMSIGFPPAAQNVFVLYRELVLDLHQQRHSTAAALLAEAIPELDNLPQVLKPLQDLKPLSSLFFHIRESPLNKNGITVWRSYHCSIITLRKYIIYERYGLINL